MDISVRYLDAYGTEYIESLNDYSYEITNVTEAENKFDHLYGPDHELLEITVDGSGYLTVAGVLYESGIDL